MAKLDLKDSQSPDCKGGRKFDGGKLQYGLLPPLALRETVKVVVSSMEVNYNMVYCLHLLYVRQ